MTRPVDDTDVGGAYRDIPAPEPPAELDARVRALVVAELATGPATGPATEPARPAASARVVPFPRWRRVALPLATAATVLVAATLWQRRVAHEPPPATGAPLDGFVMYSAKVPNDDAGTKAMFPEPHATQPPAEVPLARVAQAPSAPPIAVAPARARRAEPPMAEAKLAELAEQAASAPATTAPAAAAPAPALPEETRTYAARSAIPPAPMAKGNAAAAGAAAVGSVQADAVATKDDATFAQARRLLAAHRPDEARALLVRWQATHAGAAVPEDLRPLLPDAPR